MKKYIAIIALVFAPLISYADDATIHANVLSTLLAQFVAQVNAIDSMNAQIAQAVDKTQFTGLIAILQKQIDYSTQEIAALLNPTTVQENIPATQQTPVFGSTIAPVTVASITAVPSFMGHVDAANDVPYGVWFIKVTVQNSDGSYPEPKDASVGGLVVKMNAPDNIDGVNQTKTIDTITEEDKTPFHTFSYTPATSGTKTLTFTVGDLAQTVTIEVK